MNRPEAAMPMLEPERLRGEKPDTGDVRTWTNGMIERNLAWAESVSWEPGESGYRWWSWFRQELREEKHRRQEAFVRGRRDDSGDTASAPNAGAARVGSMSAGSVRDGRSNTSDTRKGGQE